MPGGVYPHPLIAREGWPFLAVAIVLALTLTWTGPWLLAGVAWLAVAFIGQFFRDPPRAVPEVANAVLSPADGKVMVVERARDPYLDRDALKISVFMNVFNVHSNRSPVDGHVKERWYHAGGFFNAALDKASLENERNALHIARADGVDVVCVQVAGLIARRILCYVSPGDRLSRGQRFGFIRFGSRVDVYLPPTATPRIAVGDAVYATTTILAQA
ncbi:MAG TPA: phosphatidylserine decarboxylase [Casimicrobiaceae bacterium]|nr:phosphatidylserine decarboxylase [Casimicrobiaceae bacterium]